MKIERLSSPLDWFRYGQNPAVPIKIKTEMTAILKHFYNYIVIYWLFHGTKRWFLKKKIFKNLNQKPQRMLFSNITNREQ